MLDECDLPACGFEAQPSPYGALSYVMLARCRADSVRCLLGGPAPADVARARAGGSGGAKEAEAVGVSSYLSSVWWLPVERDVKVIRFCDGAVTKMQLF